MPNAALFSALKSHQSVQLRLPILPKLPPSTPSAIREAAAVRADFPVIAAADPLGGAAISPTAAMCADTHELQGFRQILHHSSFRN